MPKKLFQDVADSHELDLTAPISVTQSEQITVSDAPVTDKAKSTTTTPLVNPKRRAKFTTNNSKLKFNIDSFMHQPHVKLMMPGVKFVDAYVKQLKAVLSQFTGNPSDLPKILTLMSGYEMIVSHHEDIQLTSGKYKKKLKDIAIALNIFYSESEPVLKVVHDSFVEPPVTDQQHD